MGVTGCSKSSLDATFSKRLNITFQDANDLHLAGNT